MGSRPSDAFPSRHSSHPFLLHWLLPARDPLPFGFGFVPAGTPGQRRGPLFLEALTTCPVPRLRTPQIGTLFLWRAAVEGVSECSVAGSRSDYWPHAVTSTLPAPLNRVTDDPLSRIVATGCDSVMLTPVVVLL